MSRSTKAPPLGPPTAASATGSAPGSALGSGVGSGSASGPLLGARPGPTPLPAGASGSFRRVAIERIDSHRARLTELVDRLAGDVILRHVSGQRVLDLGHGSERIAGWVEGRAASLSVIESEALEKTAGIGDGEADVVYCLRTLAHVGEDDASSVAAASHLLGEIARVLAPDGVAVVQIENPRSLMGFYAGIRNPITVVGSGSTVVDPRKGLTRFDTIARAVDMLPNSLELAGVHGLRIFVPLPHVLGIPVVGRLLAWAEWLGRDRPLLRRFGAHVLLVLRRLPSL